MIKVYLSGASKCVSDEGVSWRNIAKELATMMDNVTVWSPNDYFNYSTRPPINDRECMKLFLHAIEQCDVVLVNLQATNQSVGTGMEVIKAKDLRKPIIGFNNTDAYPWIVECCDVVLSTNLNDTLKYIAEMYGKLH